ncbi:MAG TPA: hypothetical protein VGG72_21430 [Bryobacteraceae bacterium]|jgi:hypothetical protein
MWTQNYDLYRDTVIINRLTQRQSVNVPYMKKTLKTYLTQTNWPVDNEYEDKGNDGQKELFLNAYWQACSDRLRLDILEEVDRKQEWLYGRSFMKLNIVDGWISMEVIDPQDILLDRYANPWDIHSGRRITHIGIYRTLSDIKRNPLYDAEAISRLEVFFATKQGLIQAGQNSLAVAERSQRMLDMGVPDVLLPMLGETYVELNEMQYKSWDDAKQEDVTMVCVTANGTEILMDRPITDLLGENLTDILKSYGMAFTIASWAGDTERTDVWSDGGADSVRGLNLVANARWSQKVENGTLVNYGMNFYDSTLKEGWTPVGYDPAPFGFYPLPGPPKDVLTNVQIPEMEDVFNELNFIGGEIQGVSGATAIENGDTDPNPQGAQQTAQEIQILAAKAKQRAQNISKYHKRYWEDIGNIFVALVMANGSTMTKPTLHKKGPSGKFYPKTLDLEKVYSKQGYKVAVGSKADKESDALQNVQKLQIATAQFPNNIPLQKIQKQKTLDWLDLTPEEKAEVMNFEDQQPPGITPAMPPNGPKLPLAPPPQQQGRMPQPSLPQPVAA